MSVLLSPGGRRCPIFQFRFMVAREFIGYAEQTPNDSLSAEFDKYFREPPVPLSHDPLNWWKENCHRYPHVSALANKYLCLPATSVPSERVFSTAGLVVNRLRTRLSPKHVDILIFVRKNLYKSEEFSAAEEDSDSE